MTSPTRPSYALLAWLSILSERQEEGMAPLDLALFRQCVPIARRLVVFADPFLSTDAGADVDALHGEYTDLTRADIFYTLGIAIGLELAASLHGLTPEGDAR